MFEKYQSRFCIRWITGAIAKLHEEGLKKAVRYRTDLEVARSAKRTHFIVLGWPPLCGIRSRRLGSGQLDMVVLSALETI